jgi:transcriptional regulator with XRE-family HTH domain
VTHRKTRLHRNPIVLALELAEELKRDGISKAELARRHGMSRARVTQWLSLLDLHRLEIERVLAMGDYWERRMVTERGLRKKAMNAE